jgi:hypothetical protein
MSAELIYTSVGLSTKFDRQAEGRNKVGPLELLNESELAHCEREGCKGQSLEDRQRLCWSGIVKRKKVMRVNSGIDQTLLKYALTSTRNQ